MKPLWESVWRVLRKVKMKLPYHSAIPLVGVCPKDSKSYY